MKNKLLILFSIFVLMPTLAAAQEAPLYRVVYLWDVTYSTHGGYGGDSLPNKPRKVGNETVNIVHYDQKYDIYDRMVNELIRHINGIENVQTEIVVVPFNEDVLDEWKAMATQEGKKYLVEKISAYCNKDQTNTNIYAPFVYAKEKLLSPKAIVHSDLIILTDGGHSGGRKIIKTSQLIPSNDKFHDLLRNWCDFAKPNNVKGYYFLLTDAVTRQDNKLADVLKDHECILMITPEEYQKYGLALRTSRYSIKRDQPLDLKENYNKPVKLTVVLDDSNKKIQGVEKIHVYTSDNPYVSFDKDISIDSTTIAEKSASIEIQLKYNEDLTALQNRMPATTSVTLNFEQLNSEGEARNELITHSCELRFINKPQKKLKITLK